MTALILSTGDPVGATETAAAHAAKVANIGAQFLASTPEILQQEINAFISVLQGNSFFELDFD